MIISKSTLGVRARSGYTPPLAVGHVLNKVWLIEKQGRRRASPSRHHLKKTSGAVKIKKIRKLTKWGRQAREWDKIMQLDLDS